MDRDRNSGLELPRYKFEVNIISRLLFPLPPPAPPPAPLPILLYLFSSFSFSSSSVLVVELMALDMPGKHSSTKLYDQYSQSQI